MEATEGFAGWVLNAFQLQRTRVHHIKPAAVKGNVYMRVSCHTHMDTDTWGKTKAHLRVCNSRCASSSCKYMGGFFKL